MSTGEVIVSIALSVGLDREFSYRWPHHFGAEPRAGERVLVPFGPRVLVGVVRPVKVRREELGELELREVLERLDAASPPTLSPDLVELCEWIARYYLAPVGEAYRLVLPGLLANADARVVRATPMGAAALAADDQGPLLRQVSGGVELNKDERRLLQTIVEAGAKGVAAAKLTRLRPRIAGALNLLAQLEAVGLCEVDWEGAGELEGRKEMHYRRTALLRGRSVDEPALKAVVGRSKQRRALLDYLESLDEEWVAAGELRGPFPRATQLLPPLVEGGLVVAEARPRALNAFDAKAPEPSTPQLPTDDQARALIELHDAIDGGEFRSVLLHGITGSGKTEVYLQAIARALELERGAIVLVPEIALTPQLADRFRARFGERVAVLHSALTPRQRLDAWDQIRQGKRRIVIGPRSALFAPLSRLGVIVVDEEHDSSFKQEEGVRYSARDLALVRGQANDALVILGSATPSLESYALAKQGRHAYLRLTSRPTPRPLPQVELLSLAVHRPDPETMLSAKLRQAVLNCVEGGDQAILFLNRRGYTASMTCLDCGALQACPDCSAPSMTYHLERNRLMCHLCGHIADSPRKCRSCGADALVHGRGGTERIEVALAQSLPGLRILRLDRDTSRGRKLLEVLRRFRDREADVLVGTQMLSKGHDFPGVTLVGIVQGDHALGLPDPRASSSAAAKPS